ncbi:MAG: polysaccharide deacetylase family protein [Bacteroidales bacterium]|nr:polysaccharide deacetylase family protein [Bacteroidales bacterium]
MKTLTVKISDKFVPEKTYALNVLLGEILGLDYVIEPHDKEDTVICFDDRSITIKDAFWRNFDDGTEYISAGSLPKPKKMESAYAPEKDMIVLYGDGTINNAGDKEFICNNDILAGAFFMLTRWEEIAVKERDAHNRFQAISSVAYKNGFLDRPVVNEYAELLWNMLTALGYAGERRLQGYELVPTHDIDWLEFRHFRRKSLKMAAYQLLKKRAVRKSVKLLGDVFGADPYDQFGYFMRQSEKNGLKSHFYFMSAAPHTDSFSADNYLGRPKFRKVLQSVVSRGHNVGFHPGYFSYTDPAEWSREHDALRKVVGTEIVEGRQHFLMFENPTTLRQWDENGMTLDSTLSYADHEGFRCGTGCVYTFYDVMSRKPLRLKERPLVVMDCTVNGYRNLTKEELLATFRHYTDLGKKYRMPITILVHNSFFYGVNRKVWKELYPIILSM